MSLNESIVEDTTMTGFGERGNAFLHQTAAPGIVPFSRYLCITTETMEQCQHDLD